MVEKKHPEVPGCVVRLTGDAVEDLETLFKVDPQIVLGLEEDDPD